MPIEVDETERLTEIASATVAVARERGTRSVTIRAVAEHLGRSTAFITNFMPSRADLMVNALEHAQERWSTDRAASLKGVTGRERLAALSRWMCSSSDSDMVLRSLWIEVIADVRRETQPAYDVLRAVTDSTYEEFRRSAEEADLADAEQIAEILYLYCRGYHTKAVEDPARWNDERVNRALDVLLPSLLDGARRL